MHEEREAEGNQGTLGVTDTLIFKCSDGDTDACLKLSTLMKVYTSKYVSPSRGCQIERGEYGPCYCSNDGARGSAGLVGGGGGGGGGVTHKLHGRLATVLYTCN